MVELRAVLVALASSADRIIGRPARRVVASQSWRGVVLLPRHSRRSKARFHGPAVSLWTSVTGGARWGLLEWMFDGIPPP